MSALTTPPWENIFFLQASWQKAGIPCSSWAGGMGSIHANFDTQNLPSFCRWRFEMKLSPLKTPGIVQRGRKPKKPIFGQVLAFVFGHFFRKA
jgi:hypothetical protein